ncbi:hypothetical protein AJ80_09631 [Polytolypa hystricis UAMH7299]|uniref:SWIM-type domain-containing protein n=1 Tax=Polytolypa hystricis (strain UAMH7299) TaxID=1447883 RepID=A0A2B7WMU7_POLH7|nr:hypothetical protein AJ80_09631 [Polytolypa hystricis UAMH7299]
MQREESSPLPSPPQLISSIIHQLSLADLQVLDAAPHASDSTIIRNGTSLPQSPFSAGLVPQVKPLLLTLHCLFPNELLLALDILDRQLIIRYIEASPLIGATCGEGQETRAASHVHGEEHPGKSRRGDSMFFVQSSSSTTAQTQMECRSYIVCLSSWNCTCPAFILATFRDETGTSTTSNIEVTDEHPGMPLYPSGTGNGQDGGEVTWRFGGTLTKLRKKCDIPVCKHILACILGAHCPKLFRDGVKEVMAEMQAIAGRHAGG